VATIKEAQAQIGMAQQVAVLAHRAGKETLGNFI
jgi:hypothetical protein